MAWLYSSPRLKVHQREDGDPGDQAKRHGGETLVCNCVAKGGEENQQHNCMDAEGCNGCDHCVTMICPNQNGGDESENAHYEIVYRKPREYGIARVPALHCLSARDGGYDADKECENGCNLM